MPQTLFLLLLQLCWWLCLHPQVSWLAVRELRLSYHTTGIILTVIYKYTPYEAVLEIPQQQPMLLLIERMENYMGTTVAVRDDNTTPQRYPPRSRTLEGLI